MTTVNYLQVMYCKQNATMENVGNMENRQINKRRTMEDCLYPINYNKPSNTTLDVTFKMPEVIFNKGLGIVGSLATRTFPSTEMKMKTIGE